jgi:hypothetical protein
MLNPIVASFHCCELLLASCDTEYIAFSNSQGTISLRERRHALRHEKGKDQLHVPAFGNTRKRDA